ncbi:MAG: sigma-70 family RNA polymerase sigma factor [Pseudanabaenales cyanobacterium]|nr:sigma-70 family RNA polymerase sigma factor [Pseudanabaenales cyanobacterium]
MKSLTPLEDIAVTETVPRAEEPPATVHSYDNEDIRLIDEFVTHKKSAASSKSYHKGTFHDDSVEAFFRAMSRYSLLTAEQEIEFSRQVKFLLTVETQRDRLTQELGQIPSRSELAIALAVSETELEQRCQQGWVAKRKMICANLRLVVSIAKRYLNHDAPFPDLIHEGVLGLNRAVEKFDPEKGARFSTYAYWWIREGITRSLANDWRTIRLPGHIVTRLKKLKQASRDLRRKLGRNPTEAELAKALEIPLAKLRMLQQVSCRSLSLNRLVGKEEEESELVDLLEDTSQSPEQQASEVMMRQAVRDILGEVLTNHERDIIFSLYGLVHSEPYTLDRVSSMFNLPQERVRQIQTKAIRKLRRPQVAKRLKRLLKGL